MKKMFLLVVTLLAMAFSSEVLAETYLVKKGDTLSQISQRELGSWKRWQKIAKLNNIKDPRSLKAGQWIKIPKSITTIKIRPLNAKRSIISLSATKKQKVANQSSSLWHPGSKPWKLSIRSGLSGLGVSGDALIELIEDVQDNRIYSWGWIGSDGTVQDDRGDKYAMIKMGFGKGLFMDNPKPAWKDSSHLEAIKIYRFHDTFVGFPLICGNPTLLKVLPSPPTTSLSLIPPSKKVVNTPPEFVYAPPKGENDWLVEHEPTVGVWKGGNSIADWEGLYAEYLAWYRTGSYCRMDNGWSAGLGLFGYYSEGKSYISDYRWREDGIGPQVGLKYISADLWQAQAKLRFLWEDVDGHNDASGYGMHQDDFKLGLYTEYVDFSDLVESGHYWGITAEAWWMLKSSAKISSTWSGDQPANRSSFYLGGFWQTKLNDDWQLRLLAGLFHQEWDDLTGVRIAAELRFWETLMFGPSVAFYPFGLSDTYNGIATASDLLTWTAFARLEMQKPISNWFCSREKAKVKAEDTAWLNKIIKQLEAETVKF